MGLVTVSTPIERLLRTLAEWLDATAPLAGPTPTTAKLDVAGYPCTTPTPHLLADAQIDRLSGVLAVDTAVLIAHQASKTDNP
ncbi:hypothetical protein [Streptomyces bugieae]|uniref:Uncharacterized protein n=1 Tax=Streptomyces bugieae TaxID=3098223 RepID=A0ABU7NL03_9ACTN|nr:hypothetical protein [Streptomyces sp. DSM 41528]